MQAFAARLLVQIAGNDAAHPLHDLLADTSYTYSTDSINGDFAAFIATLEADEPTTASEKDAYWFDYLPFINAVADSQALSAEDFSTALQGTYLDDVMPLDLNAYRENFYAGTAGNDELRITSTAFGNATQFGNGNNQILLDRAGNDTLAGRDGNDVYIFDSSAGNDLVDDDYQSVAEGKIDSIILYEALPEDVVLSVAGEDLVITLPNAGKTITVQDQYETELLGDDRLYYDSIERIVFGDGTIWNLKYLDDLALNLLPGNVETALVGTSGNDVLTVGIYTGSITGGAGADRFVLDATERWNMATITDFNLAEGDRLDVLATEFNADTLDEVYSLSSMTLTQTVEGTIIEYANGRVALLQGYKASDITTEFFISNTLDYGAGQNLSGTSGADSLTGTYANDTISGLGGNDSMAGGLGRDYFYGGAGNDTLWGEYGNDALYGDADNDVLWGGAANDTLDGGNGNDTMHGEAGNDTYYVNAAGDTANENTDEGTDTVNSSVSFTLGAHLETLYLSSSGNSGTGNALNNRITGNSVANLLTGLDGNDTLEGGSGNDTMIGGTGDDYYIVNATGDVVTENANEGIDTVQSSVTFTLSATLEHLILTSSSSLSGTGNGLDNSIIGNSGSNTLTGGGGNDTLDGGSSGSEDFGDFFCERWIGAAKCAAGKTDRSGVLAVLDRLFRRCRVHTRRLGVADAYSPHSYYCEEDQPA